MKKTGRRWLCGLLTAALLGGIPAYAEGAAPVQPQEAEQAVMDVWVQNSADRAFASSTMPEQAAQKIELYAARNEYEAAQILVRSSAALTGLTVQATDLAKADGTPLDASNITIYSEYSAPAGGVIGDVESTPDGSDLYTDALLPNAPLDVAENTTQPYWVRVYVPKGQAPGVYTGSLRVSAGERSEELPFSVKVYAVTIPDTDESSFKMINWFSTAGTDFGALESAVPNQYDVELFDENWWRVMESFARDLAIHRNNVIFIDAEALLMPESTLLGSDSRKPYVTGTDGKMAAGKYLFDWKNFDRMVDLFQNAGAMQYIYLAGNSKVIRGADDQMQLYVLEDGGNGKLVRVLKPIYTDQAAQTVNPEAEEYLKTMFRALRSHMSERYPLLLDKLYVSALDEPHVSAQNMASNWYYSTIREVYPEALSNEAHDRFTTQMTESTTLCPVLNTYEENQAYYQKERSEGRELWYYTCIGPQGDYLNRFIPYHLVKTRLIPWYAYQIGASGYLHWGYSYWGLKDTMNDMQTGDEWLVRPDIPNYDVFTSVRNEAQLDGLEDYELLTQLGAKDPEAAKQVAGQLIRSATLYTREGTAATAAHKTLLDLLTGEAAEPIAVELFRDDFANGYDYAWDRDGTAGTQWSVRDGRYTYSGAGTNATAMSTLHSQTLRDGRIDFTVKLGDAMNGDQSMWAGLCFRKANAADTAFQSGYTLCIRKNGGLLLFRGSPWKVLYEGSADLDTQEALQLSVSMNGGRIRVWNGSRLLIDAEDTDAEAPAAGYLSLVGTGIQAEFSAFRLSSYHGVETPCVSSAVMRDQSYQDSFAAETGIWRYQGAEIRDGALRFAGSGNIGSATLEGRVFSECEVSFTCDLSGTQTTANAEDHWAGLTLGRETMYGDIWGYGGYLLLLRKTGRVELLSARGALASAQLESALDGPAQVRVVRRAGTIEVYVNGAEQPVLSASAPDYTEGFLSLNACGGEVSFDDFAVTGVRQNENSVLLDDFSGDLGRWKKVKEPERIAVADGKLCTSGVLVKADAENGVQGKGVSPDLVYTERTFQNVRIGFDVRLKDIALTENWAGAYFHSGGTDGFWSSGGYLVYLTNLGNLVVYRAGSLASASIATDPMKQTVHLEVELRNGTIRVYVDYAAQPLIEVKDSTFTGGYFGLCSDFADAEFDNIYYQDLGEVEQPEEPEKPVVWDEAFEDDFEAGVDSWTLVSDAAGALSGLNGKLRLTGTSGADPAIAALTGYAYTDMDAETELVLPSKSSGWAALAFGREKWNDSIWSNGYFAYACYDQQTEKAEIKLFKTNTGDVGSAAVDWTKGDTAKLRVVVSEKTIRVYFAGGEEPVITYRDETYQGGFLGLCAYMSRCQFDSFRVKKPDAQEQPEQPEQPVVWDEAFADDFESGAQAWVAVSPNAGTMACESGALKLTGTSGADPFMAALSGRAYTSMDASVGLTLPSKSAGWSAVAFGREKWNDSIWSNGYFVYACYNEAAGKAELTLFRTNVGAVGYAELDWAAEQAGTLRIRISGTQISVYFADAAEPIIRYTAEDYRGGYIALCSYSASADFDNFTIRKTAYPVRLPDIFTGAASAEHGSDYTFRATDAEHYVYGEVSAVMAGAPVEVTINSDGSYTVRNVTGELVISGSRTERPSLCTVRFDSRGGSAVDEQTVRSGETAARPADPVKAGFRFAGWYTADGSAYTFTEPVTGSLTLYAQWLPAEVPVHPSIPSNRKPSGSAAFTDVARSHWAYDAVEYAVRNDLFNGVSDTLFAPEGKMTRAMLVTVLWRAEGCPAESTASGFVDVARGKWYSEAVAWASANGIVNGVDTQHFCPDAEVTREQIAVILWRMAGCPRAEAALSEYTDGSSVHAFAREAMAWAVDTELFRGDAAGTLRPNAPATRAEVAALMQRYLEQL